MTAAPVDREVCRTYWSVARNDGHDRPDEEFLAFQRIVLAEDAPVVCNQVPPEIPLEPGAELHVRADGSPWNTGAGCGTGLGDPVRPGRSQPGDGSGPRYGDDVRDLTTLPKAHLHIHLEGAMRPPTLEALAADSGTYGPAGAGASMASPPSPTCTSPPAGCSTPKRGCAGWSARWSRTPPRDGVVWIEPAFYAPATGPSSAATGRRSRSSSTSCRSSGARLGVGTGLIVAADRTVDPAEAVDLARMAAAFAGLGVIGFGLANDETHWPPEPFAPAFSIALDAGLLSLPHGGDPILGRARW